MGKGTNAPWVAGWLAGWLAGAVLGRTARALGVVAWVFAVHACHFHIEGIDVPVGPPGSDLSGDGGRSDMPHATFVPSHVAAIHVEEGASSLIGAKDIDTELLTIDGKAPPAGVIFSAETTHDEWAVLSVRDLEVPSELRVHGRRALIVIAVGTVRIAAAIRAGADGRIPGPGGQFIGPGHGGDGKSNLTFDSGGGGAGHGVPGAAGGDTDGLNNYEGGLAGPMYTGELEAGSGGGDGSGLSGGTTTCGDGPDFSKGGAGGGAIQISAAGSIEIGAGGGIDAGGGGGRGGCSGPATAGGGGGSGGIIWLEAPSMQILGKVAANGGAGGSGGYNIGINNPGKKGENGRLDATAAAGGQSQGFVSGTGGNGGVLGKDATRGEHSTNAGGAGGAVGRVRIRTHAAAPITGAETVVSPMAQLTTDF